MTETLTVALADRTYPIYIGHGLIGNAADYCRDLNASRFVIVTDDTVAALHLHALVQSLQNSGLPGDAVIVAAGESSKSFTVLEKLCNDILALGIDRRTCIIALGGGVIGDLAGFAAAILLRGLPFVQMPTTLLAQVDSSVGGKTGINAPYGKNLVGAFYQPKKVLIDLDVLQTLPDRQMRAGYAEIVKYGLINDAGFFAWCEDNATKILARDPGALLYAIRHSCAAKAAIVAADEREENGQRALLNLGHTFGHAFEAETGFSDQLLHGEGVALGTCCAFKLSEQLGYITAADTQRVIAHFNAIGLPTDLALFCFDADQLIAHMHKDKKAENSQLNFVLPTAIGRCGIVKNVDAVQVRQAIKT